MRAFFFLVLVCLCSCSISDKIRTPEFNQYPLLNEIQTEEFVLESVLQNEKLKPFRASYRGEVEDTFGKKSFRQSFVFKDQSKFRLEFFVSNLNRLASIMVADGEELKILDLAKKEALVVGVEQQNVIYDSILSFLTFDILYLYQGRLPLEDAEDIKLRINGESHYLEFIKSSRKYKAIIKRVENGELLTQFAEVSDLDNEVIAKFELAYESKDYPNQIRFWSAGKNLLGQLNLEQKSYVDILPEKLFNLTIPSNFTRH